jgi:hypothetical protein
MTLDPKTKSALIEQTRDAAAAFLEDFDHFKSLLSSADVKRDDARRISASLRRLLNENDLRIVANPRAGKIRILGSDFSQVYLEAAKNTKVVAFYGVDPAGPAFPFHSMSVGEWPNFIEQKSEMEFDRFRDQRIIFFGKKWISRSSVIRYVANEKQGVHSGKEAKDIAINDALSRIEAATQIRIQNGRVHITNKDHPLDAQKSTYTKNAFTIPLAVMMSTAFMLVKSSDVIRLADIIRLEIE